MHDETKREALGRFLRARRESLAPEQVGIASSRGRRTPGLRREEVAFLADIGVKWYARLESGDEIHPSATTLQGIASALQLSSTELEYILDLAGFSRPVAGDGANGSMPGAFAALLKCFRGVAITVSDRIATPLFWNAVADALFDHSRFTDPIERNILVRTIRDPDYIALIGNAREEMVLHAAGMLRLNQTSSSPSPFAAQVYDRVKDDPLFKEVWQRRHIASEETQQVITVRNHPALGQLRVYVVDLNSMLRGALLLRMHVPADEQTTANFSRLEQLGKGRISYGPRNLTLVQATASH